MIVQHFYDQTVMNNEDLLLRQQHLLARSAELRLQMSHQAQILKKPLAIADQVKLGLQWLNHNPIWPLVGLLVLIVLRPRRTITWGQRIFWAWNTVKRAKRWTSSLPLPKFSR